MKQQILSRSRLNRSSIIRFVAHESKNITKDDQIENLRAAIDVYRCRSSGNGRQAIFGIPRQVTLDDPVAAQKICAEITTKFMEQTCKRDEYHTEHGDFFPRI